MSLEEKRKWDDMIDMKVADISSGSLETIPPGSVMCLFRELAERITVLFEKEE